VIRLATAGLVLSLATPVAAQHVRDSAGVRLVSYGLTDRPKAQWRVSVRPSLVIGGDGATGAARLSSISDVLRLADGSLAVSLLTDGEIRVFDSTGVHRRTLGSHGRGPGKFSSVWELFQIADTVVGIDGLGLGQAFTTAGRYVRLVHRPTTSLEQVRRIGYLGDGSLIGYFADPSATLPPGTSTQMLTIVRLDRRGVASRLGRFEGAVLTRHGAARPRRVIYGPRAVVTTLGQTVCVAFSARYRIQCLDSLGTPRVVFTRQVAPMPRVTDADRQLFFTGVDSANPLPRGQAFRAEVRATTDFAERFAPIGRFVTSSDDRLWVGPSMSGDGGLFLNPLPPTAAVWSVYSATGAWLADVTLPAGFRLMVATPDQVIGLSRTAKGAEQVVAYRLER
jgi:hypothetical protein